MTREERIHEAYNFNPECRKYLDSNGWCQKRKGLNFEIIQKSIAIDTDGYLWRPVSLRGIENNNGWIVITKVQDIVLDTEFPMHEVYNKFKHIHVVHAHETSSLWHSLQITCYRPIKKSDHPLFTEV